MKHLDEIWRDWIGNIAIVITENKVALEEYIQTPRGAKEAVEWLAVLVVSLAVNGIWASWMLWHTLLPAIW